MNNLWQTELLQAAVLTFEGLCFWFPDSVLAEEHLQAPFEAAVRVSFQGPVAGCLVLRLYGSLLASLAGNMLGEESCLLFCQAVRCASVKWPMSSAVTCCREL